MASDNGKAGEIDWYDVWGAAEYIGRKYQGSVEISFGAALETTRPHMLLCATFVGHEPTRPRGAAGSHVVPYEPGAMRKVPELAHQLLLELQEEIDSLSPGVIVVLEPKGL